MYYHVIHARTDTNNNDNNNNFNFNLSTRTPVFPPTPGDWPASRRRTIRRIAISLVPKLRTTRTPSVCRCACLGPPKYQNSFVGNLTAVKRISRITLYAYRRVYLQFVSHILDRVYHVQSHLYAAHGVVLSGLRETRHAVITVAQKFDAKTVVFLNFETTNRDKSTAVIYYNIIIIMNILDETIVPQLIYRSWQTDRSTL